MDRYELSIPDLTINFEADRLRRDHHELIGELSVKCGLPGAAVVNGYLTTGDFNFSSVRARQDRAKLLTQRAGTNGNIDWFLLLEEFCQGVFQAERTGDPSVDLRTLPRPERGDEIRIEGLVFPRRHPSILFGDGGAAKSYTGLYFVGLLAQRGLNVALFDWELCADDHRDRLELIFGADMPQIQYCLCDRPLTTELDRLGRVVREHRIDYAVYDSVAFACDGRPEDAEVAGRYFRAVRQIGCGSLHIAHVNKSEDNDKKPFGSSFWHNGARCTWNVQAEEPGPTGDLRLGYFHRKANLGPLSPPTSLVLSFTSDRTIFRKAEVADSPDLARKLSIRQKVQAVLKRGAMTPEEMSAEIEADLESVKRELRRRKDQFVLLPGGRYGLSA